MLSELLGSNTTVVELGDSVAGSYCGLLFARLGATVVKVEPAEGSPLRGLPPFLAPPAQTHSATFTALNAGKQRFEADVDSEAGQLAVRELLRSGCDIVVMSGKRSEWEARQLGPSRIRELIPQAVIGRVTTFGDAGPYADFIGGDLQAQALGGLMNMVGIPSREPLRIGGYQAQRSTGLAMLSGFAIAMFRRTQTGNGATFATSVIETVAQVEWKGGLFYQANGSIVTRGDGGSQAILRANDGFFAFFYRPGDWPKVLALFDDPRLREERFATAEARDLNRPALVEVLNEYTAQRAKRDLYHRTQANGLTTGYMATMGDLLTSEQYRFRGFLEDVDLGDLGVGRLPKAPWRVFDEVA